MNQFRDRAIVLSRTNFGEADRILIVLTEKHGKIRLMARGVRKIRSKLAGGIELFSISHITYIVGKSDIYTLTSSRLDSHYGNIVKDVNRTMYGYKILKIINRTLEDGAGEDYFDLLSGLLKGLDVERLSQELLETWFNLNFLKTMGNGPNLSTDSDGNKLEETSSYIFDLENMCFKLTANGKFSAKEIKLMRLVQSQTEPTKLVNLNVDDDTIENANRLGRAMLKQFTKV